MNISWQWLNHLLLEVYLWGQRRRWPLPAPVRNILRFTVMKTVGRTCADTASEEDKWPDPLPLAGGDNAAGPICKEPVHRAASIPLATSIRPTHHDVQPGTHTRLRCVVATGTLDLGGLEIVALFLARGLLYHGFDTTVAHAALARSGDIGTVERPAESLRFDGVPVVKLSQNNVEQWLRTHRPDVISMHSPPDWLVAAAADARIPSIETLHGAHSFFDRENWPKERFRSQKITGFVAVSELVRRQYLRANPEYPSDRIITIPNGIDVHHISRRDRALARAWLGIDTEFLFVCLARYTLQKNTYGLVTAFSDVAREHPEARLLLAGAISDPAYYQQVRRLRDGLPCSGQIHMRGPCPDVSTVLAAADAFVLNSFFEGWSLASMEALCAGLPVVLSEVGGAREQVGDDGQRGFVVGNPLGDPDTVDWRSIGRAKFSSQNNRAALVGAMSAVIEDRSHWRQLREELQGESLVRFSSDICLQRHAEVLTRVAAGERLSSGIAGGS